MSVAETVLFSDNATSTRITHSGLRRLIQAVWLLVTLLDIVVFVAGISDYARSLHYGCLCDYTYIDVRNGAVILEPFPKGPLAGLVQDGDVLIAVDGKLLPPSATTAQVVAMTNAGEADSVVTLTLRTGDAPLRDITIKRSGGPIVDIGLKLGLSLEAAIAFPLVIEIIVFVGLAGVALFIGWKRSDDWMALGASVILLSYGLIGGDVFGILSSYRPSLLWGVFHASVQAIAYAILVTFPDGRFRPRLSLIVMLFWALWQFPLQTGFIVVDDFTGNIVALVFILMGLTIVAYRYRRFFPPLRRQQTKWLFFGLGAALLINQFFSLVTDILYSQPFYQSYLLARTIDGLSYPFVRLTLLLVPLSFAFAVMRYRLWNIDLTVNRSLVYSVVTLILGGLFLTAFFISDQALSKILGSSQSAVAAAISAAVIALCFNPTRKRVRTFIDRRIYRFRFDLNELQQAQKPVEIANPGLLSGKTLAGYQVLSVLGKGGMGEVYQGQNGTRVAAIKILPPDLATKPDFVKRFEREAQMLARFNHPNIVKVYDAGHSDGIYYIAMEFIDGQELSGLIRQRGAIPIEEVRPLFAEFAAALDYAHQNGLVHRDIKPSNIMLRRLSHQAAIHIVLMDFGVAKIQDAQTSLTGSGAIGTIGYMAPEQIVASRAVDHRADIYALGVVLYEMLMGAMRSRTKSQPFLNC